MCLRTARTHPLQDKIAHTEDVELELTSEIKQLNAQNSQLNLHNMHLSKQVAESQHDSTRLQEQVATIQSENIELSHKLSATSAEIQHVAQQAENTRALEALVAEMVDKNGRLETALWNMDANSSIEQQAQLGSQNALRMLAEEVGRQNEVLTLRFREEQISSNNSHLALQQGQLNLQTECQRLKHEAEIAQNKLHLQLQEALNKSAVPAETTLALQNNDWAQRLQMWHRRALAAEKEVERLEEAVLEAQRNNTFHTLVNQVREPTTSPPRQHSIHAGSNLDQTQ